MGSLVRWFWHLALTDERKRDLIQHCILIWCINPLKIFQNSFHFTSNIHSVRLNDPCFKCFKKLYIIPSYPSNNKNMDKNLSSFIWEQFRSPNSNLTEHVPKIPPAPPLSSTCDSSNPTCTPRRLHQSFCIQLLTASPPMYSCKLCGESQLASRLLSAIWSPVVPPPHPHDTCTSPCHHRPRRSSDRCWLPGNPPLPVPLPVCKIKGFRISVQYPPMSWNLPRWNTPLHSSRFLAMSGSGAHSSFATREEEEEEEEEEEIYLNIR